MERDGSADRLDRPTADAAEDSGVAIRRQRLALLARTETAALERIVEQLGVTSAIPSYRVLKRPENGLAMVQARAGGNGAPFNFGEMTVTRCVVSLEQDGLLGVGYVAGRDRRKAELVALFDALAQRPDWEPRLEAALFQPESRRQAAARAARLAQVSSTRVDFFTLVRGED